MIYSGDKLSRTQDVFLLQRQFQQYLDSSHVVSLLEKTILDLQGTKRQYNSITVSINIIIIICGCRPIPQTARPQGSAGNCVLFSSTFPNSLALQCPCMPIGPFHRHVTHCINEALKAEAWQLAPSLLMRKKLRHNTVQRND
jgi:hypothetical protein